MLAFKTSYKTCMMQFVPTQLGLRRFCARDRSQAPFGEVWCQGCVAYVRIKNTGICAVRPHPSDCWHTCLTTFTGPREALSLGGVANV